jgi:hypothetical protein
LPAAGVLARSDKPGTSASWTLAVIADGSPGEFRLDIDEIRLY